jgi:Ca2+-binding RTX toxin-like protein
MGGPGLDVGFGIVAEGSGLTHITGFFAETADFDPGPGVVNLTGAGLDDAFVVTLDADGGFVSASSAGAAETDRGNGIAVDGSGRVYLTGVFNGTVDFDPGPGVVSLTSAGKGDVFVWKLVQQLECEGRAATIVGTDAADVLRGTRRADVIHGRGGDDLIQGLAGNDTICGGAGADRILGGPGRDVITGDRGNDDLRGGGGADDLSGGLGSDVLVGGSGRDELRGGADDDTLLGSDGPDNLAGGSGDDSLNGGQGIDDLDGGAGTDTCRAGETTVRCEG